MQKSKWLIMGRTATGKDFLSAILTKSGMRQVKSYTTRPMRTENEDTHIFVSEEEARRHTDKVAQTVINGYEYFATREQVNDSDIYVIDPKGMYELTGNMPEQTFRIVYLIPADEEKRIKSAKDRGSDPEKEMAMYRTRTVDEDEQFSRFESELTRREMRRDSDIPENVVSVGVFVNRYDPADMLELAEMIVRENNEV